MGWQKVEHYISRLSPNLYPLNKLLIAPHFYRSFGRLPRRPSNPKADYHDFLVDRMAHNRWTDLELSCVDKELAKQIAKDLAGVNSPKTVEVIDTPRGTTLEDLRRRLAPYQGQRLIAKPTHGNLATVFLDHATDKDMVMLYRWSRYNHFYSLREAQYARLRPKIIVEQNIAPQVGDLRDFKFFCSRGRILFVQIDTERHVHHKRILVVPPDFERLPVHFGSRLCENVREPRTRRIVFSIVVS